MHIFKAKTSTLTHIYTDRQTDTNEQTCLQQQSLGQLLAAPVLFVVVAAAASAPSEMFSISFSLFSLLFIVGLSHSMFHHVIVNALYSRNSFRHGNMKLKVGTTDRLAMKKFFSPDSSFFIS